MGSKITLLFFCISLAIALMITSEVAARELAETSTSFSYNATTTKGLEKPKCRAGNYARCIRGRGEYPGGGHGGHPRGGYERLPGRSNGGYGAPPPGYHGGGNGGNPGGGSSGGYGLTPRYPPGGSRGGYGMHAEPRN